MVFSLVHLCRPRETAIRQDRVWGKEHPYPWRSGRTADATHTHTRRTQAPHKTALAPLLSCAPLADVMSFPQPRTRVFVLSSSRAALGKPAPSSAVLPTGDRRLGPPTR